MRRDIIQAVKTVLPSVLMMVILICILAYGSSTTSAKPVTKPADIVKTVAHVPIEDDGYELIFTDEENDIAYYRYTEKRSLASEGDTVFTVNGDSVKVLSTDTYTFDVEYANAFYPGMSGSAITNVKGDVIGFVSSLVNSERVTCIWN